MKILFLIRSLEQGGAERQLVNLAKALHKRGHEVAIAVYYSGGIFERDLEGVTLYDLKKTGRWDIASFLFRLLRLIKRTSPDVLHSYMGTSNTLTAMLKPVIASTTVWGVRASKMDLSAYGKLHMLLYWLESRLSRFADTIIVNSHQGKKDAIADGFSPDKLHVIPNGIDCDRFQTNLVAGLAIREKWKIDATTPLVGIVGRLDVMKDHRTFLTAASILAEKNSKMKFACIGGGSPSMIADLKKFEATFPTLSEKVIWAGAEKDVTPWYNAMDICVSASAFGEGFSNTLAEAMACGTPCVATNVGDAKFLLGDTGAIVPPQTPQKLAEACNQMLAQIKAQPDLSEQLRYRITHFFSVENLTERTEAILLDLVGKSI